MKDGEKDDEIVASMEEPTAPDGGYGWVVCAISFGSFAILSGLGWVIMIFFVLVCMHPLISLITAAHNFL